MLHLNGASIHSLLPAHPLLFLALPVSFRLRRLPTLVSISSDQVVIAAHPIHLGAPPLITVSVLPCGLMRMQSTVWLSDAHWRQAVLAKNQQSCCHVPQGPTSGHPRPNIPSESQPQVQGVPTVGS